MSIRPVLCHEEDALEHALELMSHNHVRRLPVLDHDEKLVGILSVDDFMAPSFQPAALEVLFYSSCPIVPGTFTSATRAAGQAWAVHRSFKPHPRRDKVDGLLEVGIPPPGLSAQSTFLGSVRSARYSYGTDCLDDVELIAQMPWSLLLSFPCRKGRLRQATLLRAPSGVDRVQVVGIAVEDIAAARLVYEATAS